MILSPSVALKPAVRVVERGSAGRRTTRQFGREALAHDCFPLPDRAGPHHNGQPAITALNETALVRYRQESMLAEPVIREQP